MSSATLPDDTPVDPDDELLVAYLDGELDSKSESDLMKRLVDDTDLNSRLRHLQEGWEWLDRLPLATPSEKLVESTLELCVADIVKSYPHRDGRGAKYRLWLSIAAASVLGIVLSLLAIYFIRAGQYRQQLHDLAIAENLDAYLYGGDSELMRSLYANAAWRQMITAAQEVGEIGTVSSINVAATPIDQRDEMLQELPMEDSDLLAERWQRFTRMDPVSQDRVRQTAASVQQQTDAELLLQTMAAYNLWREKLPPELVDQIESSDAELQTAAVKRGIELTQSATMDRSRTQLDDETAERIYFVLRTILHQRINAGDEMTIKQMESMQESFVNVNVEPFVIGAIVASSGWGWQRGGRRSSSRGPGRSPGGPSGGPNRPRYERPAPLNDEELAMIQVILPQGSYDTLMAITEMASLEDSQIYRNLTLRSWAEEAWRRAMPIGREKLTLLERYNRLPADEREKFDLLPPGEMLEQVARPRFSIPGR